ncbi:glycosyltransferase family 2 protein [Priestia flexa]|uniref:glycosyltransferase family 2 protein n=1 Tax=Priestia flexa TaxID=86664 RepID=UPI003CFE9E37
MKFSLVLATYGRYDEVKKFLKSIENSEFNTQNIEIIIVDQNDEINLDNLVEQFRNSLNVLHIRSKKKGLSINRNIGLQHASGEFIAFPDDDCEYLSDTLSEVERYFKENPTASLVLGKIIDKNNLNSIREWALNKQKITKNNFFTKFSSITMFYKKEVFKVVNFNENLGVGAKYGSCEDADIIFKVLKIFGNAFYTPNIKIYHPDERKISTPISKIYNYGLGFGRFCKENFCLGISLLFLKVIVYHTLGLLKGMLTINKSLIIRKYIAISSRFKGLIYK